MCAILNSKDYIYYVNLMNSMGLAPWQSPSHKTCVHPMYKQGVRLLSQCNSIFILIQSPNIFLFDIYT